LSTSICLIDQFCASVVDGRPPSLARRKGSPSPPSTRLSRPLPSSPRLGRTGRLGWLLDSGEYWWRFFTSPFSTKRLQYRTELDRPIFSLYKTKRLVEHKKQRCHIIKGLNADFQKTWFGRNSTGETTDIEGVTYAQVVRYVVELIYRTVKTQIIYRRAMSLEFSSSGEVWDFFFCFFTFLTGAEQLCFCCVLRSFSKVGDSRRDRTPTDYLNFYGTVR